MSLKCWVFCLQEILDQIVDVDLVVNFKCTNNHLGRKDLGSETTACQELLTVGNSGFPATVANSACKEKLRIYAEQVNSNLF